MKTAPGFFDALFFTEATFGQPIVRGATLEIPVKGVFALADHPLVDAAQPLSGTLVFTDTVRSARRLIEYIGDPTRPSGFKEPYEIEDQGLTGGGLHAQRDYEFEGVLETPMAWIENWTVRAGAFEFQIGSQP